MCFKEYFADKKCLGVMATSVAEGKVDVAAYTFSPD